MSQISWPLGAKKAKDFLPFLQHNRRMTAVVEYVLSGHRFKLFVPKKTCSIAFSLSCVRCPGRDEPYSNDAISLMRRKMQRDVEIEVETVDRTGTFIGSLWESKTNVGAILLEAGLAKLQTGFGAARIADAHLLAQAEQSAKRQKLKIWENYVKGEEVTNGSTPIEKKQKEEFKDVVTEVLDGGKFYVQAVADQKVSAIQQQLASLNIKEAHVIGAFNPKKGDIVLAQFTADNSWNQAMVVNGPRGDVQSSKDKFEVFYIDFGNQETVTYNQLHPANPSVSSAPGLAQLCQLAYLKVPSLDEDYGQEAAVHLSESTLAEPKEFKAVIEERDTSGGKVKGQGTGNVLLVTLIDEKADTSINANMLKVEAKRALSREEHQTSRPGSNVGRSSGGAGNYRTKKIFVGGLPATLTEEQFRQYFESYGDVTDVVIMFDQNTQRPRGFGFITFDTEDAVDRVVQKTFHELNNKAVEVKRALPKDATSGGGGGRGGGYQGNNSSGSFDPQMDGNRFLQQSAGGGYPAYSGYGQPSYGFGGPNANAGYGGYGSYGVGGYGSGNAGYGPAGAYPGGANSGYLGGNPGALKSPWGGQSPGYGSLGYGPNVGYGSNVSAPSQSATGASGYSSQAYGYGNYGSNDGYNTNPGGYGAAAGRFGPGGAASGDQQGTGDGYNGQTGYSNAAWRSDS